MTRGAAKPAGFVAGRLPERPSGSGDSGQAVGGGWRQHRCGQSDRGCRPPGCVGNVTARVRHVCDPHRLGDPLATNHLEHGPVLELNRESLSNASPDPVVVRDTADVAEWQDSHTLGPLVARGTIALVCLPVDKLGGKPVLQLKEVIGGAINLRSPDDRTGRDVH